MSINGLKIGIGLTGSFCTFEKTFQLLEQLKKEGAIVTTVFSPLSQTVKCRFGTGEEFLERAHEITEKSPIPNSPKYPLFQQNYRFTHFNIL